jgi:hypothetical protein
MEGQVEGCLVEGLAKGLKTLTNIVYWKLVKPKSKEERHFTI